MSKKRKNVGGGGGDVDKVKTRKTDYHLMRRKQTLDAAKNKPKPKKKSTPKEGGTPLSIPGKLVEYVRKERKRPHREIGRVQKPTDLHGGRGALDKIVKKSKGGSVKPLGVGQATHGWGKAMGSK